jgi:hypothetical protein
MTAAVAPPVDTAPERLTPERLAEEYQQTDRLLAWLLAALTFLLASFPIEDPQLLFSLSVGRMVAQGKFSFGPDPFSYTTGEGVWVHPGWLGDLLLYLVYEAGGGAGLVLLRGLLAVAIFLLMWSFQRPGGRLGIAVLVLFLAVLTMSPRLLMRTEMFSLVLLLVTLRLLWQPARQFPKTFLPTTWQLWSGGRWWIWLPPLFALWVNLDGWFLLGPALTATWLIGAWLEATLAGASSGHTPARGELRRLAIILGVGLLACVLNPYHVRVFRVPPELKSPTLDVLNESYRSRQLNLSPAQRFRPPESAAAAALRQQAQEEETTLRTDILWRPLGLALTEWTYYPLFLLGFLLLPVPAGRGLLLGIPTWILFFALSAYQVRNMAFFAVVAGPLTVLAWQSRATALPTVSRLSVLFGQLGRFLLLLAIFLCAFLMIVPVPELLDPKVRGLEAVRGWINPRGSLGWSMPLDPSLKQLHEELHRWRNSGILPENAGRLFHLDLFDAPPYQAWFDPGGRHFLDARVDLHAQTVGTFQAAYLALRRTGEPGTLAEIEQRQQVWQKLFQDWDISCLIVDSRAVVNPQNRRESIPLYQLLMNDVDPRTGKNHWLLLRYADGRNFLMLWTGSRHARRLEALKYDPRQMAFGEAAPPTPISEPPPLTAETPLGIWLRGNIERPPLALYEAEWAATLVRNGLMQVEQIERQRAEQIVAVLSHNAWAQASGWYHPPTLWIRDVIPNAEAYLAVRAARRAIAATPNVANPVQARYRAGAYKALHEAYQTLYRLELRLQPNMPPPPQRELQIVSAMRQIVALNPNDATIHQGLAVYYLTRRGPTGQPEPVYDLGYDHYRRALAIYQALGGSDGRRSPSEVEIQFKRQLFEVFGFKIDDVEKELKQRQEYWLAAAPKRNPAKPTERLAQRASMALQIGLAGRAYEELRQALDVLPAGTTFDAAELLTLGEVYLRMGETTPLLQLLTLPGLDTRIGAANYHAFGALAKAAAGDPLGAIEHRLRLLALAEQDLVRVLLFAGRLHTLGGEGPRGPHFTAVEQGGLRASAQANVLSEHWTMIGLLWLEAGQPTEAAAAFRRACLEVQRPAPYRGLAGRYYFLITKEFLDQP